MLADAKKILVTGYVNSRFLLTLLLLAFFFPQLAIGYPGIVIEYASGTVLYHEDANQSWYPASLTKMMTLYLTFEALKSGELKLDEKLTVSTHAAAQPATHLGLRKGETLSVGNAIKAVATVSANDAAVVLGERLKTSEVLFAEEMTRRAKQLGMNATVFRNASGLPDSQQKTTARDMAILAKNLIETFPEYFHYFSNRTIMYKGKRRSTTNGFTASYRGADGMKTGFTCGSGYNLVATASRNSTRLIGVVLGAGSGAARSIRMRKMLDQGFSDVEKKNTLPRLNDLAMNRKNNLSLPPVRLAAGKCGVRQVPQKYVMSEGTLPGWGLLLGVQSGRNNAVDILRKARSELKTVNISARPALLKREFQKGSSWKVLLVGLEKVQAGQACVHLLSKAMNCVIQSPKRMNSPGYSKR